MSEMKGHCLCGKIHYTVSGKPIAARVCWCHDCQKIASNGTVNAIFSNEMLNIQGELKAFTKTSDSGNTIDRLFCPECGSHLFARSSGRPNFTVLRIGTLETPSHIQPSMNIWADSAPEWACLDEGLERSAGQPAHK